MDRRRFVAGLAAATVAFTAAPATAANRTRLRYRRWRRTQTGDYMTLRYREF